MILTEKENEVVKRHSYGYIIVSMNPYSLEYSGTKPLNAAFRRRMRGWITFDYPSVADTISPSEVAIVLRRSDLKDKEIGIKIVRTAAELRALYKRGEIPAAPTLQNLIDWALLIVEGEDILEAADIVITDMIAEDEDTKMRTKQVIETIFGI
jgi:nitric oxide reductase NorQ protein